MTGPNDTTIDEIVASCNGDLRGALRALLPVGGVGNREKWKSLRLAP